MRYSWPELVGAVAAAGTLWFSMQSCAVEQVRGEVLKTAATKEDLGRVEQKVDRLYELMLDIAEHKGKR